MKKLMVKGLALLNSVEGVAHLIVAGIGLWGCWDTGIWDWRLLAPVVENVAFGLFSLFTGIVLGRWHHHH